VGDALFYADGRTDRRTDMMKLIVAFHNCAKAPKKIIGKITYVSRNMQPIRFQIFFGVISRLCQEKG
jgi:hypothetical protein